MRTYSLLFLTACGAANITPSNGPCTTLRANALKITEIMIDPEGSDTGGEWVEVYNPQSSPIQLEGVTLYSGASSLVLDAKDLEPGAFFTAGDSKEERTWLDVAYGTALGAFGQSSGSVGLRCGELTIDEVRWAEAPKAGRSRMLDPSGISWCDAPASTTYVGGNHGSPREPNPPCFSALSCIDERGQSRSIVAPGPAALIITEVMAAPKVATDSVGEWFELFATDDVDLNGVTVATSTGSSTLESASCLHVAQGDYALIARSADPFINGGLPPPLARFTGSLSSSNERLKLLHGDAGIDEVAFFRSSSGVAWQLGIESLSSDTNDDPSTFCAATKTWPDGGGDLGSPGAANTRCQPSTPIEEPKPDAGSHEGCLDAKTKRTRAIVEPTSSALVITELMANPSAVNDETGEWFEVLANRAFDLNGVALGNDGSSVTTISSSDCISVAAGTTLVFARNVNTALNGGLPRVDGVFSFSLANSGSRFVRLLKDNVELVRMPYSGTTAGASVQRDPKTGEPCATPTANVYGHGDRGTPGRQNVACP